MPERAGDIGHGDDHRPASRRAGAGPPSVTTAAAPVEIARAANRPPSTRRPRRAKNTAPGATARLSSHTAVTVLSSPKGIDAYPARSAPRFGPDDASHALTITESSPLLVPALPRRR